MKRRPALLPASGSGVLGLVSALAILLAIRGERMWPALLSLPMVLRLGLWVLAPYARWAWIMIEPDEKPLKRMREQADALEGSKVPMLGALSRRAYRHEWWRRKPAE